MNREAFGNLSDNFGELMQAGRMAYSRGDRRRAHDLWREAATVDPYNEQVWIALLDVLDTIEDKMVCLQNIVAINPMNIQARRELRAYGAKTQELRMVREIAPRSLPRRRPSERRPSQDGLLPRAVLLGVGLGLSGVLFAIVLSILIYGH